MSYGTVVMKFPILFLISSVFLGTDGEVYYVPKITDDVYGCDDFNNELINCDDLKVGSTKGDNGDDAAKLSGMISTQEEISVDYDIEIDIWKVLDLANEYMYTTRVNFCASLENTDAPYYPIVEKLNITGCPVPGSVFEVHGLTISLDSLKDVLCHDVCGDYQIQFSFMDGLEKKSCHIIELRIEEEDSEDE